MAQPIRVMIDARMLIGRFAGIARFVTQLVEHLAPRRDIQLVPLCAGEVHDPWRGRDDIEPVTCSFSRLDRTPFRRLRWEARHLADCIKRHRIDVYHATWNSGIPANCPAPTILTIHDLIPWREPASHLAARIHQWSYRYGVRSSARRATVVTTVSDYVRGQVMDTLGLVGDRVRTVYNGVNPADRRSSQMKPSNPEYVLYVGGFEERKNIAGLLRMMRAYWSSHDPSLELRLTGDATSLSGEAARNYEELPDNSPIRFMGSINDDELAQLYHGATALLTCSLDEGFGLPVLEAMAHACPVIASNRSCLPEIVGDAGLLIDPDDPKTAADAIRALRADKGIRDELIVKGLARAAEFSWSRTADQFTELYRHAARGANRGAGRILTSARHSLCAVAPDTVGSPS